MKTRILIALLALLCVSSSACLPPWERGCYDYPQETCADGFTPAGRKK